MRTTCLLVLAIAFSTGALAQSSSAGLPSTSTSASEQAIDEILVEGEYPGPGLWKVTRADDPSGHALWVLGEPPPLPKKLKWQSATIEETVRDSPEVLFPSALIVRPDERIGLFKGISLVPAALRARKNPDGAKLRELLPEDLYARWRTQKKKYLPRNTAIERWRPLFAAEKLQAKALAKSGFGSPEAARTVVAKLAAKHHIKTTTPSLHFTFPVRTIKPALKQFSREHLADLECFATTLDLVEAISDSATMTARANAWATGDVAMLSAIAALPDPSHACVAAFLGSTIAQEIVPEDITAQLDALWIAQAEKSLAENVSTFALLPFSQVTSAGGYLATLRVKGYVVTEPEQLPYARQPLSVTKIIRRATGATADSAYRDAHRRSRRSRPSCRARDRSPDKA